MRAGHVYHVCVNHLKDTEQDKFDLLVSLESGAHQSREGSLKWWTD